MSAHWRPSRLFNGHLGIAVSALIDGQLDEASEERAWTHVHECGQCRQLVEREGWIKRQLSSVVAGPREDAPAPSDLVGSLLDLGPVADAWEQVEELERRSRNRRRAGIALVGAGSVSAAVLGLTTLGGASFGFGGGAAPASSIHDGANSSRPTPAVVAPAASVHGRLRGWTLGAGGDGVARAHVVSDHR